ncbi:MAG: pyridoxal-phosphate dependent enzyme [Polyangiaceae bacterium]|nr:pyridoxal-phosphate dependent enzyme [Polyangiaceae bacterium]
MRGCADVDRPELFRALPGAEGVLPWMPIGAFPTDVERHRGLVSDSIELWVKREDRSHPIYGGGKVRKLEFLMGDARVRGLSRLATFGGTGSHHVLATAIHGAAAGFEVEATLFPQPLDEHVRELVVAGHSASASLHGVPSLLGVVPSMLRALRRRDTAWLAGGGSSTIGTLGWVSGGLEILAQARAGVFPMPDIVYAALGSCGMVAGLLCGLRHARPPEIVAVRVVGGPFCGETATRRLARNVDARLSRFRHDVSGGPRLRVEAGQLGRGYGYSTEASRRAVAIAAEHGLCLDPIYTGKVMASLLADADAGRLDGKRVLFIHSFSHDAWRSAVDREMGPARLPRALRRLVEPGAEA